MSASYTPGSDENSIRPLQPRYTLHDVAVIHRRPPLQHPRATLVVNPGLKSL